MWKPETLPEVGVLRSELPAELGTLRWLGPARIADFAGLLVLGREHLLWTSVRGKLMLLVRGPPFESADLNEIGKGGQGYSSTN